MVINVGKRGHHQRAVNSTRVMKTYARSTEVNLSQLEKRNIKDEENAVKFLHPNLSYLGLITSSRLTYQVSKYNLCANFQAPNQKST